MRILIVEDDSSVTQTLAIALKKAAYNLDCAADGAQAIELLELNPYDLLILDLNLPDLDGLEVCRHARSLNPSLPILILTARTGTADVIKGLDLGADDYITKPYRLQEMLARVRACLRRNAASRDPLLKVKDICLDTRERTAWKGSHRLDLSRKEFAILEVLMRHPGQVVSQEKLLEHAWGSDADFFSNTVRVHISSLRRKLQGLSSAASADRPPTEVLAYIETVTGEGYRILPDEDETR